MSKIDRFYRNLRDDDCNGIRASGACTMILLFDFVRMEIFNINCLNFQDECKGFEEFSLKIMKNLFVFFSFFFISRTITSEGKRKRKNFPS